MVLLVASMVGRHTRRWSPGVKVAGAAPGHKKGLPTARGHENGALAIELLDGVRSGPTFRRSALLPQTGDLPLFRLLSMGVVAYATWLLWSGIYEPLLMSFGLASCVVVIWPRPS